MSGSIGTSLGDRSPYRQNAKQEIKQTSSDSIWLRVGLLLTMIAPLMIMSFLSLKYFIVPYIFMVIYIVVIFVAGAILLTERTFNTQTDWKHFVFLNNSCRLKLIAFAWWPLSIIIFITYFGGLVIKKTFNWLLRGTF